MRPLSGPIRTLLPSNLYVFISIAKLKVTLRFAQSSPVATPSPKAKEVPKDTVIIYHSDSHVQHQETDVNQASPVSTVPNPFFGTRVPSKKNAPVHLKEDFNPFRHAKVAEASQICTSITVYISSTKV